jgi:hypothetical protein
MSPGSLRRLLALTLISVGCRGAEEQSSRAVPEVSPEIANADQRPTWKRGDFLGRTFGRKAAEARIAARTGNLT